MMESNEKRLEKISDLPHWMQSTLPKDALELYLEGYRRGWELYSEDASSKLDRAEAAHREGWNAITREFEQDEGMGKWHRIGEEVEKEEQGSKTLIDRIRDIF